MNSGLYNQCLQNAWNFLGSQKGFDRCTTQLTAIFTQPIDWKCTDSTQTSSLALCQWYPCQRGNPSKISDVHSINLMDQMSEFMDVSVQRPHPLGVDMFTSWLVCPQAQQGDSGWGLSLRRHPVSRAELGQQRLLVGELERCCPLTHRKEKEGKKQTKMFAFNWGIMRDCLTYLCPWINRWPFSVSGFRACWAFHWTPPIMLFNGKLPEFRGRLILFPFFFLSKLTFRDVQSITQSLP